MPEIKTPPIKITIDGEEYDAFGEDHTLLDIIRWLGEDKDEVKNLIELFRD